jgi:hypothetical protein
MAEKTLMELTDAELNEALSIQVNRNVVFGYNDVRNEIERRRQQKNADRVYRLSTLAIKVSVVSLAISTLVALFNIVLLLLRQR